MNNPTPQAASDALEIPTKPGFYWAKWKICNPGTADEESFRPCDHWEVVQVFENSLDEKAEDHLMVFVSGVQKAQSLENFFWGQEVIRALLTAAAQPAPDHIGWAREWEGDDSDLGNYIVELCLPGEPKPDDNPNWFPLYTSPQPATDTTGEGEYTPGKWFICKSIDQMQAFYMSRLPAIREAAKECGYAIGLHGSTRRDFDLIAVPWIDKPASRFDLAKAVHFAACGFKQKHYDWALRPHGRMATAFPICWPEWDGCHEMVSKGHLDLSVIDTALLSKPAAVPDGYAIVPLKWPEEKHRELSYALSLPSPAAQYERLVKEAALSAPPPNDERGG